MNNWTYQSAGLPPEQTKFAQTPLVGTSVFIMYAKDESEVGPYVCLGLEEGFMKFFEPEVGIVFWVPPAQILQLTPKLGQ